MLEDNNKSPAGLRIFVQDKTKRGGFYLVGASGLEPLKRKNAADLQSASIAARKYAHICGTAKQTVPLLLSPPERPLRISYAFRRTTAALSALGDKFLHNITPL